MTGKEIARAYGLDRYRLEQYIANTSYAEQANIGIVKVTVNDSIVPELVDSFKRYLQDEDRKATEAKKLEEEKEEQARRATEEKKKALASMLITSGFAFDGHTITRYSGYISGDDVIQIDRSEGFIFTKSTDVGQALTKSLVTIRRNALSELKEAAYALGCNAVVIEKNI